MKVLFLIFIAVFFSSCSKDKDIIVTVKANVTIAVIYDPVTNLHEDKWMLTLTFDKPVVGMVHGMVKWLYVSSLYYNTPEGGESYMAYSNGTSVSDTLTRGAHWSESVTTVELITISAEGYEFRQ